MSVDEKQSEDGKIKTFYISGRFDFSIQSEFRKHYKDDSQTGIKYVVDLSKTDYIDSSALGMLLLLKEHADNNNSNAEIINPPEPIMKILTMANFDKIFTIS